MLTKHSATIAGNPPPSYISLREILGAGPWGQHPGEIRHESGIRKDPFFVYRHRGRGDGKIREYQKNVLSTKH